jgi:hypothetical protein
MRNATNISMLAARAALVASLAGVVSCGGMSAGDYVIYRVAFVEKAIQEAGCYPKDEVPVSELYDSTTFRSGQTFVLYMADDEEATLDTGGVVLKGSMEDEPYTFSGSTEDVDFPFDDAVLDSDRDGLADINDPFVDADKDGKSDEEITSDPEVDTDGDALDDREGDPFVDADNDGDEDRFVQIVGDTKMVTTLQLDIEMRVDGSTIRGTSTRTTHARCEGTACPTDEDVPCVSRLTFRGVEIDDADLVLENQSDVGP